MNQPITATDPLPSDQLQADPPGIKLRYFNFDAKLYQQIILYTAQFPHNVRQVQLDALAQLGITVAEGQSPLTAWILEMAKENQLPQITPQHEVGGAAAELCPRWVYFLA